MNILNIERKEHGLIEILDHNSIQQIELTIDQDSNEDVFSAKGKCLIVFRDGRVKSIKQRWDLYHAQTYGISVSEDGSLLFTAGWNKGIIAVRIEDGKIAWKSKKRGIQELFVFPDFLCAFKVETGLLKYDIQTGKLLGSFGSIDMQNCFRLDQKQVLLNSYMGFLVVVDLETEDLVCVFTPEQFNPNRCRSWLLQGAWLEQGELFIRGIEEQFDEHFNKISHDEFLRSLGEYKKINLQN